MSSNRTFNSLKNLFYSFGIQIGILVINFISRTIFIRVLGAEYLGINGLFTNILTLLSLAELGFGNAIIYSMYKPLAKGDTKKLSALVNFYRKIYIRVAVIVSLIGILLLPFLKYIVKTDLPIDRLSIYYLLFLGNTIASYILAYKNSIINADQKVYILKICLFITNIIQAILQITILYATKNYVLYLTVQILCTLFNNAIVSYKADKIYPFIKDKQTLGEKEKKEIYQNVSAIFIYKLSGTLLNNTDNILISMLLGTIYVGYYSNYYMITSSLIGIVMMIFNSVTASVGNLIVEGNSGQQLKVFEEMNFIAFIICGIISITLLNVFNEFIAIWVGTEFILKNNVVLMIIINFYIMGMLNPIWIFRDTTGIFKETKNVSIILGILNIVLSLILGKICGLFGILLATAVSRLLTSCWYHPYILYRDIFKVPIKKYFLRQAYYILVLVLTSAIMFYISCMINATSLILIIFKCIINVLGAGIVFVIMLYKTREFQGVYDRFFGRLKKSIKNKLLNKNVTKM